MSSTKKKISGKKNTDITQEVETPLALVVESVPPIAAVDPRIAELSARIDFLADAIRMHKIMSHRSGMRQHDAQLYKTLAG